MKNQQIEHYLEQLHCYISHAIENKPNPFPEWQGGDEWAWISEEEDRQNAPVKSIEEWTGISKDALPPHEDLNDTQLEKLYEALSKMLDVYNMSIVFHLVNTKTRAKYQVLRAYFNQEQPMLRWHYGFSMNARMKNLMINAYWAKIVTAGSLRKCVQVSLMKRNNKKEMKI